MIIEPSGDDYSYLGDELPTKGYQLPDNSWVLLEVESDYRHSEWSYFWVSFAEGGVRLAWYRVFQVGTMPPEWRPMKPVEKVLERTGVGDDDDDEDPDETKREREGKIGSAEKLPMGRYVLQAKIRVGAEDVELKGIEFRVKGGPIKAG